MANLQVKDIDENLYNSLKNLAKRKRRSVSQEVITMIESYLSHPSNKHMDTTEVFLNLAWKSDESAVALVEDLKSSRVESQRFKDSENVFD